ncbi:MAG: AAA family ATPase [Deltaproteobacteria bacterium]|jgi:hypothetical protein|nr:AAA family ATPase [Deltaproteobacteria bacterium]
MDKILSQSQDFSEIRLNGFQYVDKTQYIYNLLNMEKPCLLARPPFFGLPLFVSATRAVLDGRRELFTDLWIGKSDYDFEPRDYVYLNFNDIKCDRLFQVRKYLFAVIKKAAKAHGVGLYHKPTVRDPRNDFKYTDILLRPMEKLVSEIFLKNGHKPVTIIIEGYDTPALQFLSRSPELLLDLGDELGFLYQQLVINDQTGLVFFAGENRWNIGADPKDKQPVTDLSFDPNFANACGITDEEFRTYFAAPSKEAISDLIIDKILGPKADVADLKALLDECYGGFTWNGTDRLLNPYSTIEFFNQEALKNFSEETISPSTLEYLRQNPPNLPKIFTKKTHLGSLTKPHKRLKLTPETQMFQRGLLRWERRLTIYNLPLVSLYFPNLEVKCSVIPVLLNFSEPMLPFKMIRSLGESFKKALYDGDALKTKVVFYQLAKASPLKREHDFFDYGINLIFYLLAISDQSLQALDDLTPLEFAFSRHQTQEPEFDGHLILPRFVSKSGDPRIDQVIEKEYPPADEIKASVLEQLCPTLDPKKLTMTVWEVDFNCKTKRIKTFFKKL